MANPVKIALVGAGSVVFSMRLITDLCLTRGLYGSTISLMNRGKEKLDVVYNLAKRYAKETGADFYFEKTTDSASRSFSSVSSSGYRRYLKAESIRPQSISKSGSGYLATTHQFAFFIPRLKAVDLPASS